MCTACAARRRAETLDPSLTERAVTRFANFDMVGAMASGVAALFFGCLALKKLVSGELVSEGLLMLLPALLLLFARAQ